MLLDPMVVAAQRVESRSGPVVAAAPGSSDRIHWFMPAVPRLLCCVSGELRVLRMDAAGGLVTTDLPAGGVLVLPPRCGFDHGSSRRCRMLNIGLRPEGLLTSLRVCTAGVWRTRRACLIRPAEVPPALAAALQLCCALAMEGFIPGRGARHAVCAVLELLIGIWRTGPVQSAASRGSLLWARLEDCIQDHLDEDLGRARVAALLGIHPNHLSRFCSEQGVRYVDLVNRHRLQAACRLLAAGDDPVQVVARRCGFNSAQYFSRLFRSTQGCTPGDWRRAHVPP
ncbi:MAG: helix-turn-helix transcriptional regulator [Planctomycetota bacterium]